MIRYMGVGAVTGLSSAAASSNFCMHGINPAAALSCSLLLALLRAHPSRMIFRLHFLHPPSGMALVSGLGHPVMATIKRHLGLTSTLNKMQ